MLRVPASDCVASLVISNRFTLLRALWKLALDTANDSLRGLLKVDYSHSLGITPRSYNRSFITDVHDVSTCESWSES